MATKRNTDRFALSSSGMTNIRTAPLRGQRQTQAKKGSAQEKGKKRNGR